MKVRDIPLDKIFIKKNIRFETDEELGELMGSCQRFTQLQPIGVYPRDDHYELVWGHRRFRAAQMSGESTIAAHILHDIAEHDIPLIKLQENMVRKQLTADEIVKAADEIKAQRPSLTDRQVDSLLGKRPGYLSYHRSVVATYAWLAQQGLEKKYLSALNSEELLELKNRLQKHQAQHRRGTYHRGTRIPHAGFEIIETRGPNIIVVCSCKTTKARVVRYLRRLLVPAEGKKGGAAK
jgi:ParB family chromosome partitioning protein